MTYDNWKQTTPEDEHDEMTDKQRKENARIEDMIDELETPDTER